MVWFELGATRHSSRTVLLSRSHSLGERKSIAATIMPTKSLGA